LRAHGIAATLQQSVHELSDENRYSEHRLLAIVFMNE
jgi:hypothetical protein